MGAVYSVSVISFRSERVELIFRTPIDLFGRHEDVAAKLPSGTSPEDALKELERDMWLQSVRSRKDVTKAQEASEFDEGNDRLGGDDSVEGGDASGGAANWVLSTPTTPRQSNSTAGGSSEAVDTPDSLARMATAAHLQALAGSGAAGDGTPRGEVMDKPDEMPDEYYYPYLLLACMWTSWGGNTPSEWKYLASSSGPQKRKKSSAKDEEIDITEDNPIGSPSAMSRLNPNGDAMSRRQHYAAIKREKDLAKKDEIDKENKKARTEFLDTKKKGLAAMEEANIHVGVLSANIKRLVELREKQAAAAARAEKITSLEKKLMLGLGDPVTTKAELHSLLDQC